MLNKLKMRRGALSSANKMGLALRNPMTQECLRLRLSGLLQRPVGDPVCQDPTVRGPPNGFYLLCVDHQTGFICSAFHSPYGSCRREAII